MIAADQYIITPDQGDWAIRYNGDCLGRFASCPRAIRAAVEVADTASSSNHVCEVVVERSPSDRYTVWVRGTEHRMVVDNSKLDARRFCCIVNRH